MEQMNKIIDLIIRIIIFPFIAVIMFIHTIRIYIITMIGYLIYGGETILYSKNINRKMIYNVFLEVQKMIDKQENK